MGRGEGRNSGIRGEKWGLADREGGEGRDG